MRKRKRASCKKLVLYLQIDKKILVFISILEFLIHMNFSCSIQYLLPKKMCIIPYIFLGVVAKFIPISFLFGYICFSPLLTHPASVSLVSVYYFQTNLYHNHFLASPHNSFFFLLLPTILYTFMIMDSFGIRLQIFVEFEPTTINLTHSFYFVLLAYLHVSCFV